MRRTFAALPAVLLCCLACLWDGFANAADAPKFECRWAEGPIKIDGKADERAWRRAQTIDNFHLPWLQDNDRPARTKTTARLLWDREYLYFFAEMEDSDIYGGKVKHDGRVWDTDVFELFFKPADDKPGYYEFQVNPAGAVLDMFIPRRNSGGYERYRDDGEFHVEVKPSLRGSLDKWSDKDEGWSVEGRIPWADFLRSGGRPKKGEVWKFALCRYDYSVDFEGPELSTCAPLGSKNRPDFHYWEDYAPIRFVGPTVQNAALPGVLQKFAPVKTSRVVGSPDPPTPYLHERVLPKLEISFPVCAKLEPGGGRLYFIDQQTPFGRTRICAADDPASGEFDVLLDLDELAYDIAFHPQFANNGYLYVGSNGADEGQPKTTRITRYTIEREPFKLLADSALRIIEWESDGHNGAAMTFGHDGMLYVTSGDGTSDSDVNIKGQGLDHLLAKVLRIDVDRPENGKPYSVPADNPFVDRQGAAPETWAYGLRNPWRITTDAQTGHIWIGNNGQDLWEQVFFLERGANYGWSVYEGGHLFYAKRKLGPTPVSKPAADHPHSEARSLTGGVVYYGSQLPELRGAYIYGDYATGKIWAIRRREDGFTKPREIADTPLKITGFLTSRRGELLVLDHSDKGGLYRLGPRPKQSDAAPFPTRLSETGLFASVAKHQLQPGVIPYSVNSPLWSDGAHKARFLALVGEGDKLNYHPTKSWDLPEGAVLIKSFALEQVEGDANSRKWIETRLFTKTQGEWVGYSYKWNDRQDEAVLIGKAGADQIFEIETPRGVRKQKWRFPSRAECMVCHSRAANFVLGFSTGQLNREHDYGDKIANQLAALEAADLLRVNLRNELASQYRKLELAAGKSELAADEALKRFRATRGQRGAPSSAALLPAAPANCDRLADPYDVAASIADRARSYLHVNCASCHVVAGGGNAQMELAYDKKLEAMKLLETPPLHNKFGIDQPRLVTAKQPLRSLLLRRMALRGPGQMPPLGTSQVDKQAVELLKDWINTLDPPAAQADQPTE